MELSSKEEAKTPGDLFSYDTLIKVLELNEKGYCNFDLIDSMYEDQPYEPLCSARSGGFFEVLKKKKRPQTQVRPQEEVPANQPKSFLSSDYGLKFHISLPEDDYKFDSSCQTESRELYKRGWDIVQAILRKHDVGHFKIANDKIRMSGIYPLFLETQTILSPQEQASYTQRGKDITIYVDSDRNPPHFNENTWAQILLEITTELIKNDIPPGYKPINTGDRADNYFKGNNYVTYRYENSVPKIDPFAHIKSSFWPKDQLKNIPWDVNVNDGSASYSKCVIM